mgnify:CR=1 FL=1
MKIYCPNCYKPTEYASKAPSLCIFCKKSYIDATENIIVNKQPLKQKKIKENIENIDEYIDSDLDISVPEIDSFEYDINANLRTTQHISELVKEGKNNKVSKKLNQINKTKNKIKIKTKKISEKEFEKTWNENFPKSTRKNPVEIK